MPPRFFVSPDQIQEDRVIISGSDVHHLATVLRLKPGDMVVVADGTGREYLAELAGIDGQEARARIKEVFSPQNEPPLDIYLVQGLPKGEKMDLIVQKCTEIGIRKIIPARMEHTVVRLDRDKAGQRRERWQRIAREAAQQCRRGLIPEIEAVRDFREALALLPSGITLIMPWEAERSRGLKELLRKVPPAGPVGLVIGPEGGISPAEADLACASGAFRVSLGPRILRTETAGWVALSLILYELGDLGGSWIG